MLILVVFLNTVTEETAKKLQKTTLLLIIMYYGNKGYTTVLLSIESGQLQKLEFQHTKEQSRQEMIVPCKN